MSETYTCDSCDSEFEHNKKSGSVVNTEGALCANCHEDAYNGEIVETHHGMEEQ